MPVVELLDLEPEHAVLVMGLVGLGRAFAHAGEPGPVGMAVTG